jgi:hypothetical protein
MDDKEEGAGMPANKVSTFRAGVMPDPLKTRLFYSYFCIAGAGNLRAALSPVFPAKTAREGPLRCTEAALSGCVISFGNIPDTGSAAC